MKFSILNVGSELTLGLLTNTNATYIARKLCQEGFLCTKQTIVPDNIDSISEAIITSLSDNDGVLITGGLGPTSDDITREAICKALGLELEYQPNLAELIENRFGKDKNKLPGMIFKQAYLPSNATPIIPRIGSAPGIILMHQNKFIIAMPGVPREMQDMLENDVIPWLKEHLKPEGYFKLRILKTSIRTEAMLQESIDDIIKTAKNINIGIIAIPAEIQIQLLAKANSEQEADQILANIEKQIRQRLGNKIFGVDDDKLEQVIGELLRKHGLTFAAAESCTGGLLSKLITDIPGSSEYFIGGIVSYSNSLKVSALDVPARLLERHGAVSAATARAMAYGVREKTGADIGISITGIAGPTGDTPDKPIGLVYLALSHVSKILTSKYTFYGSRDIIRQKSAYAALDMLRGYILNTYH